MCAKPRSLGKDIFIAIAIAATIFLWSCALCVLYVFFVAHWHKVYPSDNEIKYDYRPPNSTEPDKYGRIYYKETLND